MKSLKKAKATISVRADLSEVRRQLDHLSKAMGRKPIPKSTIRETVARYVKLTFN